MLASNLRDQLRIQGETLGTNSVVLPSFFHVLLFTHAIIWPYSREWSDLTNYWFYASEPWASRRRLKSLKFRGQNAILVLKLY